MGGKNMTGGALRSAFNWAASVGACSDSASHFPVGAVEPLVGREWCAEENKKGER